MSKTYYDPQDLKKFGNITEFSESLGKKFFEWYGAVFQEGALSQREKALIALAVSHAVQCAYCIDAYTTTSLEKGANEAQMMEAVHVAAAIRHADRDGAPLVVVRMNTPGGIDTSMRQIVDAILSARTPVAVFVGPSGARA